MLTPSPRAPDWQGVEDNNDHVAMDAPVVYTGERQHPDGTPHERRDGAGAGPAYSSSERFD